MYRRSDAFLIFHFPAMKASRPRNYKKNSMLNSAEHEILNAYKYKKYQEIQLFSGTDKPTLSLMLKCHILLDFNIYEQEKFHAPLS